jgi:transposase
MSISLAVVAIIQLTFYPVTSYLNVDGYAGYEGTLVGCWAHARRYFMEANKVQAKGKSSKAGMALSFIQKLYDIELQLKGKSDADKLVIRQAKSAG